MGRCLNRLMRAWPGFAGVRGRCSSPGRYTPGVTLAMSWASCRSGRARTSRRRTGRSSDSTAHSRTGVRTAATTPQSKRDGKRSRRGCITAINTGPTRPSGSFPGHAAIEQPPRTLQLAVVKQPFVGKRHLLSHGWLALSLTTSMTQAATSWAGSCSRYRRIARPVSRRRLLVLASRILLFSILSTNSRSSMTSGGSAEGSRASSSHR